MHNVSNCETDEPPLLSDDKSLRHLYKVMVEPIQDPQKQARSKGYILVIWR